MDDLHDIANLEGYIAASQRILIFLSKDYFHSVNCMREVRATLEQQKPITFVHETDVKRGGAPLDVLRLELTESLREPLFGDLRTLRAVSIRATGHTVPL